MTNFLPRLRRLLDHLEWANRRVVEAVRRTGDEEALRLLAHLLAAERVWLRRLRTGDSGGLEIWPEATVDDCGEHLAKNVTAYRAFLDGLDDEGLDEEVAYRNSQGTEFRTAVADILCHVFLHGSYHRGQIALRLRDGGHEPVNTDFITFVR